MIPHVNKIQEVVGQEVVLYSHQLEIAGRCDLIGYFDNELSIIDYKTSNYPKNKNDIEDYWIQTTFYAIAHNEMFNTNITNLVIIMGVNNKLPLVFKSKINQSMIDKLNNRRNQFKEISNG
jgi:ATP-dependent exoDNAse (exonuclease V) beta subunit